MSGKKRKVDSECRMFKGSWTEQQLRDVHLEGTRPTGHWSRHAATNIISEQTNIEHVWPAVYLLTSRLALQQTRRSLAVHSFQLSPTFPFAVRP